jgi:hypothetical protein
MCVSQVRPAAYQFYLSLQRDLDASSTLKSL